MSLLIREETKQETEKKRDRKDDKGTGIDWIDERMYDYSYSTLQAPKKGIDTALVVSTSIGGCGTAVQLCDCYS